MRYLNLRTCKTRKILSKISDLDNKVSDINVNLDKVKSNQEEELIRKIEEERLRKIAEAEKKKERESVREISN